MSAHSFDDDDEIKEAEREGRSAKKDFDCPSCNANNPTEQPYGDGDELMCNYCGTQFLVKLSSEGRLRLKEI